jgi:hypothetical protein
MTGWHHILWLEPAHGLVFHVGNYLRVVMVAVSALVRVVLTTLSHVHVHMARQDFMMPHLEHGCVIKIMDDNKK